MTRESSLVISERYASLPNLTAYHLIILQDNVNITDQGQAQISDFGIARILDVESFMKMTQSNIRYTAPELVPADLNVDPVDVRPTFQSDIFSLGMLLLQVCG
jgi:serine/threonine protein kinase